MSSIDLFIADDHTSTGFREATLDEIMNGARQALSARVRRGTVLNSPRLTANFLIARLGQRPYETFTLIYLDLCGAAAYAKTLHYSATLA